MDSIVEGLMTQLMSGENLSLMSNKAGTDDKSVKSILEIGLPLLLGAMNKSASKPEGAQAIIGSLAQIGNNNPMDSMADYLRAPGYSQGADILSSVTGSSLEPIGQAIAKKTGIPPAVVTKVLAIAVPLVLGSLSKSNPNKTMGRDDLSKLLGEQSKMALSGSPNATAVMKDLFASQQSEGGLMGMIKKLMKS